MKSKIIILFICLSIALISGCRSIGEDVAKALSDQVFEPTIVLTSVISLYQADKGSYPNSPEDLNEYVSTLDKAPDFDISKYRDLKFEHKDDGTLVASYKQTEGDGTISITLEPNKEAPNQGMEPTR